MKWQELVVKALPAQVPVAEALLYREGAGGLVMEASGEITLLKAYFGEDYSLEEKISAWREVLSSCAVGPSPSFSISLIDDEDWAESWKRFYHPLRVGKRLVIKPSWETYAARPGDLIVELDPGMAFGSGCHPTTQLCLELLEQFLKPGDRVLDLGTGSGILAIAAAKLGAASIVATDLDPLAVKIARQNVDLNIPGFPCETRAGDGVQEIAEQFSVISANIIAETLIELAPFLPERLLPAGLLIAGGITIEKKQQVLDAFLEAGLSLSSEADREDWCALALKK
ncbi:MAG: 50S ribosomal protein L11 methyltransferase [bacterium]